MSGVDPRVDAMMREPGGVAGGASKEQGTTSSQPEKADITYHRDSCEGQTPAGKHKFRANTTLVLPLGDHTSKWNTKAESKLGPSMNVSKKKTTAGRGQGAWGSPSPPARQASGRSQCRDHDGNQTT